MKKNKKTYLLSALVLLFIFGLIILLISNKTKVADDRISATVTNVLDKPNIAEDGYYGITAIDKYGRSYTINATGYLNTPLSPESNNEICVDVPNVKNGDKISFNLPEAEGQSNTFATCYKKNITGYYFNVE
jgi:hypothetical protein